MRIQAEWTWRERNSCQLIVFVCLPRFLDAALRGTFEINRVPIPAPVPPPKLWHSWKPWRQSQPGREMTSAVGGLDELDKASDNLPNWKLFRAVIISGTGFLITCLNSTVNLSQNCFETTVYIHILLISFRHVNSTRLHHLLTSTSWLQHPAFSFLSSEWV